MLHDHLKLVCFFPSKVATTNQLPPSDHLPACTTQLHFLFRYIHRFLFSVFSFSISDISVTVGTDIIFADVPILFTLITNTRTQHEGGISACTNINNDLKLIEKVLTC